MISIALNIGPLTSYISLLLADQSYLLLLLLPNTSYFSFLNQTAIAITTDQKSKWLNLLLNSITAIQIIEFANDISIAIFIELSFAILQLHIAFDIDLFKSFFFMEYS